MVALDAIVHRDPVEAEHPRQRLGGDLVAHRDVDPDDGVPTFQQPRQLRDVVPLDAGIADHQHISLRHPPFRAQRRSRTPRKRVCDRQAYHAPHSVAWTIVVLGGHIGHPFEHLGVAGGGLYTST